jgi:hypothetical protein
MIEGSSSNRQRPLLRLNRRFCGLGFGMLIVDPPTAMAWLDSEQFDCNVLGLDPDKDRNRALRSVHSHLRRAEWMTVQGYKELLKQ